MDLSEQQENELLYVGFNQDYGKLHLPTALRIYAYYLLPARVPLRLYRAHVMGSSTWRTMPRHIS